MVVEDLYRPVPGLGHAAKTINEDREDAPGRLALPRNPHDAFARATRPRCGDQVFHALVVHLLRVRGVVFRVLPEVLQLPRAPRAVASALMRWRSMQSPACEG